MDWWAMQAVLEAVRGREVVTIFASQEQADRAFKDAERILESMPYAMTPDGAGGYRPNLPPPRRLI